MSSVRFAPSAVMAVPAVSWLYTRSAEAIFCAFMGLPDGSELHFGYEPSSSIAANRNGLVERFLRTRHELLLFCDSDMVPTPDAFGRLLAAGKPFVSATYFTRMPPHLMVAQPANGARSFAGAKERPVQEARLVGLGYALIHRRVFEKMPAPWFTHPEPGMGEDFVFCQRARALGFPPHVDLKTVVGHLGALCVDAPFAAAWQQSEEGIRQYAEAEAWNREHVAARAARA